jgi:hypothetical protein
MCYFRHYQAADGLDSFVFVDAPSNFIAAPCSAPLLPNGNAPFHAFVRADILIDITSFITGISDAGIGWRASHNFNADAVIYTHSHFNKIASLVVYSSYKLSRQALINISLIPAHASGLSTTTA